MKAKNLILLATITLGLAASCGNENEGRDVCLEANPPIDLCCADDPSLDYCDSPQDMGPDQPVSDMGGDDGPIEDMNEVDMPEDEGQPDQSEPCDNACSGQTPVCDVATDTCVECLTSNECGNGVCDTTTKSCVECLGDEDCTDGVCLTQANTEDNACVECKGNAECLTAEASLCSASNECSACVADADCSHLTNLGQCVSGTCRECTTETEDADCGGNVCDPTTFACTNLTIGDAGQLETCVSDTQCATGNACIPLNYMGAPHGNYCMPMYTQGECPNPYGAGPQNRTSVNGTQGLVCMISEARTTPEAIEAYSDNCTPATEATDCPEVGSICGVFNENAIPQTTRCTYRCAGDIDCKGGEVCAPTGIEYCRPQ